MDEIASTKNLCLYGDGTVAEARPMQEGGEDIEWVPVGDITDDYCVRTIHLRDFAYLQSEWASRLRNAGETELAGAVAYSGSRGDF